MKTLIVAGGTLDMPFAAAYTRQQGFDYTVAADAGMHFFAQVGIRPDEILGDFDSADPRQLQQFQQDPQIKFHTFPPQKDAVDTQLALELAIERGSSEIHILGGTGTRLDHVLASVRMLGIGLKHSIPCYLVDAHNRIRLVQGKSRTVIKKSAQFGRYVSLIPLTAYASGITLTGFQYPLQDYTMDGFDSLGISNEVAAEEAVVEVAEGILVLAETKD